MNLLRNCACIVYGTCIVNSVRSGLKNFTRRQSVFETRATDKSRAKTPTFLSPFLYDQMAEDAGETATTNILDHKTWNKERSLEGSEVSGSKNDLSEDPQAQQTTNHQQTKVLVTGGAGFLGQHIIKHLQERVPYVNEIRVLDVKPYRKRIRYQENKTISTVIGSVADKDAVYSACEGVDSVFHVAGLVSYGTFPDFEGMKAVNEGGTSNIISACLKHGVQRLIFCSTVDVVIGFHDIHNGNEASTGTPSKFIMPGYPETKYRAECMVLQANGKVTDKGHPLHTVSLRCNVLYGEEDPYYVTSGLRSAFDNDKVLVRIGSGKKLFQQCYAGNAAWAFLCADIALKENNKLGGGVYFIPDDTPVQNTFEFMEQFLTSRGYRLSTYYIPSCLVYYPLWLIELILHAIAPWYKKNLSLTSGNVKYINMNLYFNGEKGRRDLKYLPLYSPEEAIERSNNYYKYITFQ